MSGARAAGDRDDMELIASGADSSDMGAVPPSIDAVVASMLGGDVEAVTRAIIASGDDRWFSAVWAWARVVVELAWTASAGGGGVPLGVWVGRHLPVACKAELIEDVSVVIATAANGLASSLRERWAALGDAGRIRCGEVVLGLAVVASKEAVARHGARSHVGRGEVCRGDC